MAVVTTLAVLLLSFDLAYGQCLDNFIGHGESCYHFSHDTETWIDAQNICKMYGAALVEIKDTVENNYLGGKTAEYHADFWIGADDLLTEGEWTWSTNQETLTFTAWSHGSPSNNGGDENCAELGTNGAWNDDTCHKPQRYICEMSKEMVNVVG